MSNLDLLGELPFSLDYTTDINVAKRKSKVICENITHSKGLSESCHKRRKLLGVQSSILNFVQSLPSLTMNKDRAQTETEIKGAACSSDSTSKGTAKDKIIDQIPNYKEYSVTPFKAEALSSFYYIADMSKQKVKQYYSHLDIELKQNTADPVIASNVDVSQDKLSYSFVFNSSTISEISSIEDCLSSANSNDVGISKNIVLTPMKGLCAEDELNFSKIL